MITRRVKKKKDKPILCTVWQELLKKRLATCPLDVYQTVWQELLKERAALELLLRNPASVRNLNTV